MRAPRSSSGLTRIEVLGIFVLAIIVLLLVAPFLSPTRARPEARRANCRANINQIGKGFYMYTQSYGGYYPFAWGSSGSVAAEYRADLSLALVYPEFLETAKVFRCPNTENELEFSVSKDGLVLKDSSYGYDCRISPEAANAHALLGDMDGSYFANKRTKTQNHEGGQNVLYVDGHVSWETSNFASNNELDNIFAEDPWNADTDSYLVWPSKALGISYDDYPELQQTIETTDKH